jgi:hypothetical protein
MKKRIKGTLCDLDRDTIKKRKKALAEIVSAPEYYCAKCARVANAEQYLCKAQPLPKP